MLGIFPDCACSEANMSQAHAVHPALRRFFELPERCWVLLQAMYEKNTIFDIRAYHG
jgi:hypothetical protein